MCYPWYEYVGRCCIFLNTAAAAFICSPVHPSHLRQASKTLKHLPNVCILKVTHMQLCRQINAHTNRKELASQKGKNNKYFFWIISVFTRYCADMIRAWSICEKDIQNQTVWRLQIHRTLPTPAVTTPASSLKARTRPWRLYSLSWCLDLWVWSPSSETSWSCSQ